MIGNFVKKKYESSEVGYQIIGPLLKFRNFLSYNLKSDNKILRERFYKNFNRPINFKDPKTLNEKIIWLKLNDRTSLHTTCADKYEVRKYIREKIGDDFLVPLFFQTYDYNDISSDILPNEPVIIKTNHDSGGGIFVYDKEKVDYHKIRQSLRRRLQVNYYQRSKEWQYKNIKPCVIVEKLLQTKEGKIPLDFKLHCLGGKVRMIQVDIGRGTDNHFRNWYSTNWEREPYKWSSPKGNGKFTDPSDEEIQPPESLQKMIELSEVLAKPFAYVRVDWYDVDGQLYFGEMTFHHDGGNQPIIPKEWDAKLGALVPLPNPGHEQTD